MAEDPQVMFDALSAILDGNHPDNVGLEPTEFQIAFYERQLRAKDAEIERLQAENERLENIVRRSIKKIASKDRELNDV